MMPKSLIIIELLFCGYRNVYKVFNNNFINPGLLNLYVLSINVISIDV